ncbi:MAG: hypothetical protein PHO10_12350 [Gemmiger sp.]|nr:hypothetical protein [Gemmiger sp.]
MIQHRGTHLLLLFFAVGLGALFLACPQQAAAGFASGASLCLRSVLPAIFPFMVVGGLLATNPYAPLLGAPLRPLARFCGFSARGCRNTVPLLLLLSWLGGYAASAQSVREALRQGKLDTRDAMLLLLLGCCSGPGFVVGCVGGLLLGSPATGLLLYGLQLAANFLAAACLWPFVQGKFRRSHTAGAARAAIPQTGGVSAAILAATQSCLAVCGCILFFRVVGAVLLPLLPGVPLAQPLASALLEISAGCADFAAQPSGALQGVAFCLSVLGVSVYAQLGALLEGVLPLWPLLLARGLHCFWMQALLALCLKYLPGAAAVFSSLAPRLVVMCRTAPDAALLVFGFACAVLYKVEKSIYNKTEASEFCK